MEAEVENTSGPANSRGFIDLTTPNQDMQKTSPPDLNPTQLRVLEICKNDLTSN